jgi:hypothetical protein
MKHKNCIITSCFALALAGSAHAAGVWSTITWTGDTSLSFITSSNVTHSGDFVSPSSSAPTINGYTFEAININAGFSGISNPYSGSNFTVGLPGGYFTFDGSAGVSGTASSLLNAGLTGGGGAGSSTTYNLTGLSTNTNYAFYFFSPDYGGTRTGTMDGSDDLGNTIAIDQSGGTGNEIIKYAYNTGASTTFTMTVTTDPGDGLHNYAFANVTAIPEPSTALLGGLGLLALLRRRR